MKTLIVMLAASACLAAPTAFADPIESNPQTSTNDYTFDACAGWSCLSQVPHYALPPSHTIVHVDGGDEGYNLTWAVPVEEYYVVAATNEPPVSVPEPGTLVLLLSGILLIAYQRRAKSL